MENAIQWNLLIRTLENKDTCIIRTPDYVPKYPLAKLPGHLNNQDTLSGCPYYTDFTVLCKYRKM